MMRPAGWSAVKTRIHLPTTAAGSLPTSVASMNVEVVPDEMAVIVEASGSGADSGDCVWVCAANAVAVPVHWHSTAKRTTRAVKRCLHVERLGRTYTPPCRAHVQQSGIL